jgi:hypothetical protein
LEMKNCAAPSRMDRIVGTVLLDKLTPDSMWSEVVLTETGLSQTLRPKSYPV